MKPHVYIEVKNDRDVLNAVDEAKQHLMRAREILTRLHELRTEENKEMHVARQRLSSMEQIVHSLENEVFPE